MQEAIICNKRKQIDIYIFNEKELVDIISVKDVHITKETDEVERILKKRGIIKEEKGIKE